MSPEQTQPTRRAYRKRERARQEEATRQRIAEAAMELHGSIGPARTTISAVAERAGVQRATVYRHFPDEASLFRACSAHWDSLHPQPDPAGWGEMGDSDARLRTALRALYGWYGEDEQMFVNLSRDADLVPALRAPIEEMRESFETIVAVLGRGRRERGRARTRVRAAIAHAVSFETWYALTRRGGLDDEEAVKVASGMVAAAARG